MLSLSVKLHSSFAFRRDLILRPSAKRENPRIDRSHKKKNGIFSVFLFFLRRNAVTGPAPPTPQLLEHIRRYGLKTSRTFRTILMLLPIEGHE